MPAKTQIAGHGGRRARIRAGRELPADPGGGGERRSGHLVGPAEPALVRGDVGRRDGRGRSGRCRRRTAGTGDRAGPDRAEACPGVASAGDRRAFAGAGRASLGRPRRRGATTAQALGEDEGAADDEDRNRDEGRDRRTTAQRLGGRPPGSSRATRRCRALLLHADHPERALEALQADRLGLAVADPLDPRGQVDDGLGGKDLAGAGLRAQAGGHVEGGAAIAALDRHGLAGIEADPDAPREARRRDPGLELHGRAQGLAGRGEDGEGLVTAELDERPVAGLDRLPDEPGEPLGERRRRLVATLVGVAGVAADIGDQERAVLGGPLGGRAGRRRDRGDLVGPSRCGVGRCQPGVFAISGPHPTTSCGSSPRPV